MRGGVQGTPLWTPCLAAGRVSGQLRTYVITATWLRLFSLPTVSTQQHEQITTATVSTNQHLHNEVQFDHGGAWAVGRAAACGHIRIIAQTRKPSPSLVVWTSCVTLR